MKMINTNKQFAVTPDGKEHYKSGIFKSLRTSFEIEGIRFSDNRFKKLQQAVLKSGLHLSK